MNLARFGQTRDRRVENAQALYAFGVSVVPSSHSGVYRTVREGNRFTIFTIGYERRDGENLISMLKDAGIEHLADIREKPISRKPDFRAESLKALCNESGIEYGAWSTLGSTEDQRDRLNESGDLAHFHRVFRTHALKRLERPLEDLVKVAKKKVVALLCYERVHEECHRSVVADLLADRLGATVMAIS